MQKLPVNLKVHKKLNHTNISNGIVWSLDNKRLYIEGPTQIVQSFIFEEESGEISYDKNVVRVTVEMGTADGMAYMKKECFGSLNGEDLAFTGAIPITDG
jgi:sugar lactone lactonase YvrE